MTKPLNTANTRNNETHTGTTNRPLTVGSPCLLAHWIHASFDNFAVFLNFV